jgi:acyl-coenzyme A synthetase/AMP-(fatty) acid ligase
MNLARLVIAAADTDPARTAVRIGRDSLTYREFVDEGARVAAGLVDLGVRPGDRVMLFARNSIDYLVIYHAVARIGAVFAPIHESFQIIELEYVLANLEPAVIIADASLWERLNRCASVAAGVRFVRLGGEGSTAHGISYSDLGRSAEPVDVIDVAPDTPALICYTSGTTDHPHPVTRSHRVEVFNAETYASVWDYRREDIALIALPLSWVYGLSTLSQGLLRVGATIVLHADFVAEEVIGEIERSRVTLFAGTMSMYVALLKELQHLDADLSSLRQAYRGGEPVNVGVVEALERHLGLRLTDAYATTEVAPVLAVQATSEVHAPFGTAGRLVPGAEIRVVDDDGDDVAPGEIGEAWLGGQGRMLGYWREPELTARQVTADGWFRSGDLVRQDEDGFYYVMGRSADVIIRNGAKIAPAEIESALARIPGVRDSVVVGVPDEEFGESIVAFLQLDPGCVVSIDDVYYHLSDRIARFKLPGQIYIVDELPIRRNEKRDRASIRNHAIADLSHDLSPTHGRTRIPPAGGPPRLRLIDQQMDGRVQRRGELFSQPQPEHGEIRRRPRC